MSKPQSAETFRTPLAGSTAAYNDLRYVAVDPRAGAGLAGQIGDLVYYENAPIRQLMQKVGAADTRWVSITQRPTVIDMLTAADLQALFRVITATPALAALVDHLWQPAFGTNLGSVPDLVGANPFVRIAGTPESSLRESHLGGAVIGARAMATVMGSVSTWAIAAAAACDVTDGAFCLGGVFQPDVEGPGILTPGYWLSKRGDTGNKPGYSLNLSESGVPDFTIVDTAGVTVNVGAPLQNHARAPHPFIAGRSVTAAEISIATDMGRAAQPSGAVGSLTNAFPLAMDLRTGGVITAGMTGWIGSLWFATGAAAEAILANDIALVAHYTGLIAA